MIDAMALFYRRHQSSRLQQPLRQSGDAPACPQLYFPWFQRLLAGVCLSGCLTGCIVVEPPTTLAPTAPSRPQTAPTAPGNSPHSPAPTWLS